jgi:hypothetical protein
MPSRKTTKAAMAAAAALPSIPKELIDQFVTGPMSAEAVKAASMAFKKALIERALGASCRITWATGPGRPSPKTCGNHRNGASGKTVLTEDGPLRIEVPRDREGSLRAAAHPQARAALHRLRRQDRGHVRARHDGARDPGLPGRAVRHRGGARSSSAPSPTP